MDCYKSFLLYIVLCLLFLKAHQKLLSQKPKIDPWKASRTPSARVEPAVRTRFRSPVNASPSRVLNYPRSANYTTSGCSSVNNNLLSPGCTGASTAASTSCFSESGIMSPTGHAAATNMSPSNAHIQPQSSQSNLNPMSPTKSYAQPYHYHIQQPQFASASSISNTSYLQKNNYINSSNRIITTSSAHKAGLNNIVYNMAVPKPGYGLTSPNKSITLPNSSRYIGLVCSFFSLNISFGLAALFNFYFIFKSYSHLIVVSTLKLQAFLRLHIVSSLILFYSSHF